MAALKNMIESSRNALIEWSVASENLPGESESGDLHFVRRVQDEVLLAVVDGLGHGREATSAAVAAVGVLDQHVRESLGVILARCHDILAGTRGVVMSLARFSARESVLAWIGVGNVEGRLLRAGDVTGASTETMLLRSGVVGYQLPPLQVNYLDVAPGDTLVFATDGLGANFADAAGFIETPEGLVSRIMAQHFKKTDDALVLAARYLGRLYE